MPPSSLPSLLFYPQEQLEILHPSIHCQIFQAARKLLKRGKEISWNHQGDKSASPVLPKTLSPRIWLWHVGDVPKPNSSAKANPEVAQREH